MIVEHRRERDSSSFGLIHPVARSGHGIEVATFPCTPVVMTASPMLERVT